MHNYLNPIADFDKHIQEAEGFLQRISDSRFVTENWSLLWKNLHRFYVGVIPLANKWRGYKTSTGINPKKVIKKDLDALVRTLDVDIRKTESAVEWGIRSSQGMIDEFPALLPYLDATHFSVYVQEIGDLLDSVVARTGHGAVMKLLTEFREHPDLVAIGQFSTNEMADYCRHLRDSSHPNARDEIIRYVDIYQKFCGVYEKDMILCYCLLRLKETGNRPTYKEAHPESRNLLDRANYVRRRISLFGAVYDRDLRNEVSHNSIETDSNRHLVTVHAGRKNQPKYYTYDEVVSVARSMSALVIAFRLLPIALANRDWRSTQALLR